MWRFRRFDKFPVLCMVIKNSAYEKKNTVYALGKVSNKTIQIKCLIRTNLFLFEIKQ